MSISVIIPAFNEEFWLGATLQSIQASAAALHSSTGVATEIIVVDNNSTDETRRLALGYGARMVSEPVQGIGRARNAGARSSQEEVLVFVDADVIVPSAFLQVIHHSMGDSACVGGGVDARYSPDRFIMKLYLSLWRMLAKATGMVQGAAQFCRREAFLAVGGYDETAWNGEDVDFVWALRRLAKAKGGTVVLINELQVLLSSRRFAKWPYWKTFIWTNPVFVAMFRRRKSAWDGWFSHPVR